MAPGPDAVGRAQPDVVSTDVLGQDPRPPMLGASGSPIVPGMPAAMLHALATYGSGRISRRQALAPAIRLAEEGFKVDPYVEGLAARGHRLRVVNEDSQSFSFARPNGIRIDPQTGRLTGGVNQHVPAWAMGHDA